MITRAALLTWIPILFLANQAPGGETVGATERFVERCELILYGKEVPVATYQGRRGYLVEKKQDLVTVNGVLFYPPKQTAAPAADVTPDIQQIANVIQSAATLVRSSRDKKTGAMTVSGVAHDSGATFPMNVPEYGATVTVSLATNDGFAIEYQGQRVMFFGSNGTQSNQPVKTPADAAFEELTTHLRPGLLVVKGAGYAYSFPISEAASVRASLAEIASEAEIERSDRTGVHYRPLKIGRYFWDGAVVRDFVASGGGEK